MNWEAFLATIGHGVHLWGAFILCFALMAVEVLRLSRRIRSARVAVAAGAFDARRGVGQAADGQLRLATARIDDDR